MDPNRHPDARKLARPALLWALGHGLLVPFFFRGALARAAAPHGGAVEAALWLGFAIEGLAIGLATFAAGLPLLALGRRYAWAAPALTALATAFFFVDSLVFGSLGFHVNGLVLSVALQPGALAETGLPLAEVLLLGAGAALALALDVWAGNRFLRRYAGRGRAWPLALALLLLWAGERTGMAALAFARGQAIAAASTTLPLQPPLRMNGALSKLTGRKAMAELRLDALPDAGTPLGRLDPADVALRRRPDVIFLLVESLRADFFTPEVMPNLWRRAQDGTRYTRHYAAASSTHFSVFSLFYGLDAQRRDAVIGAGRSPLLFPALRRGGWRLELFAASSVDWMELKDTVFGDVRDGLRTGYEGVGAERDARMIADADRAVDDAAPGEPLFLFLFFDGTHFNYSYPPDAERFRPAWDGKGSFAATTVDAELLKNRARNAAFEVDRKIERVLRRIEERRGRSPLVIFTSDHGEEFREHGRVGHASDVTSLQLHVPMVVIDERSPKGVVDRPTGHVDVLPTLLSLLGDESDPSLYSDGVPMHEAEPGRYVLSTVGWEPRYALVGEALKVRFLGQDGGFGSVALTDPDDRPLEDGEARFALEAPRILKRLRGRLGPVTQAARSWD